MKLVKKVLLAASIVLIVGILISSASLAVVNWDLARLSTQQNVVSKVYQNGLSQLSDIWIGTEDVDIEIVSTTEPLLTITYNERELEPFTIVEENGILRIDKTESAKLKKTASLGWFDHINLKMKIEVPTRYAGSIHVDTTSINLKIRKLEHLDEIVCNTTSGSMAFSDLSAQSISLRSDNSRVQFDDVVTDGSVEVVTSNGPIDARGLAAPQIGLETTNGKIYVDKLESKSILLQTTNGKIRGYINGNEEDYTIRAQTVQGKNNLEDREGNTAKKLEAYSVNGGIDITFERELPRAEKPMDVAEE